MSVDAQRPIVVKKIKKGGHGHHGGAWKIAYADFVTAMMAFFLLMWLLTSVNKAKLRGISEYFSQPLKVIFDTHGTGNRQSIMDGGGEDFTKTTGEFNRKSMNSVITIDMQKEIGKSPKSEMDKKRLEALEKKIEKSIEKNAELLKIRDQLKIGMTADGLRIQLLDKQNRPMFDLGSSSMKSYSLTLLNEVGPILNDVPNRISISGHTDAKPYASGDNGYSNWELSADRANESRRQLIAGGLHPDKVLRVVGLADAVPYNPDDIYDPINRRISITVLNDEAERNIVRENEKDGATVQQLKSAQEALKKGANNAPDKLSMDKPSTDKPSTVPEQVKPKGGEHHVDVHGH